MSHVLKFYSDVWRRGFGHSQPLVSSRLVLACVQVIFVFKMCWFETILSLSCDQYQHKLKVNTHKPNTILNDTQIKHSQTHGKHTMHLTSAQKLILCWTIFWAQVKYTVALCGTLWRLITNWFFPYPSCPSSQGSCDQHGAHLGPHELCYQGHVSLALG